MRYTVRWYKRLRSKVLEHIQMRSALMRYSRMRSRLIQHKQVRSTVRQYTRLRSKVLQYIQLRSTLLGHIMIRSLVLSYILMDVQQNLMIEEDMMNSMMSKCIIAIKDHEIYLQKIASNTRITSRVCQFIHVLSSQKVWNHFCSTLSDLPDVSKFISVIIYKNYNFIILLTRKY